MKMVHFEAFKADMQIHTTEFVYNLYASFNVMNGTNGTTSYENPIW